MSLYTVIIRGSGTKQLIDSYRHFVPYLCSFISQLFFDGIGTLFQLKKFVQEFLLLPLPVFSLTVFVRLIFSGSALLRCH